MRDRSRCRTNPGCPRNRHRRLPHGLGAGQRGGGRGGAARLPLRGGDGARDHGGPAAALPRSAFRSPQQTLAAAPARRGRAASRRRQAPHPRRHGAVPRPPLPRAGRRPASPRRRDRPGRRAPRQPPRACPPHPVDARCRRDRAGRHGRTLGHLVRHARPVSPALGHHYALHHRSPRPADEEVASE